MASLQAYDWEHKKFPAERDIEIPYEERTHLTRILIKKFNLPHVDIFRDLNHSGGKANSGGRPYIRLPKAKHRCCLGTIYHEIAHILNGYKFNGHGHRGTFKTSVIKVYCEARQFIEQARAEAQAIIVKEREEYNKLSQAQALKAEREKQMKANRQTPAYKIEQLNKRIKRLETRAKRINTLMKSAKRSLAAYERHVAKRREKEQCQNTNSALEKIVES